MTPGGTWSFPPGRALHGWFGDLSVRRPQQLWFCHLLLHRVECLAVVNLTHRLDAIQLALLRVLSAADGGATGAAFDRLHIDRQLLLQWLQGLTTQRLARSHAQGWELTEAGRNAAATGAFTQPGHERRAFYFVDHREAKRPAHFLQLVRSGKPFQSAGMDIQFDPRWLENCVVKPPEWKRVHRFPTDVEAVVVGSPQRDAQAVLPWRTVLFDRYEHLPVVAIRTDAGVQGFAAQTEDWKLASAEPVFELAEDWQAALPDLALEPHIDLWRAAWSTWCRQRSLPAAETDGCLLERHDLRLEVRVSKRLFDRLKAARNELLHGETWLLAGTGRTRTAANVKIAEGEV